MRFSVIVIGLLAIGLLFVSACTTGGPSGQYAAPQQYGGGGCGASASPLGVLGNTLSAAVSGNNGGC